MTAVATQRSVKMVSRLAVAVALVVVCGCGGGVEHIKRQGDL